MAATWRATSGAVAYAATKDMLNVFNSTGVQTVRVYRAWHFNNGTAAVTGVLTTMQCRRITAASAGTVVTPVAHDTSSAALSGNSRVTIGVSDDPTYPFLYLIVWGGPASGNFPYFTLVWDTVIRGSVVGAADPLRSVFGTWASPIYDHLSSPFLSSPGEGWWGSYGTPGVVERLRTTSPGQYGIANLAARFGRSGAGRTWRRPMRVHRTMYDTAPTGFKGRLRNLEICMRSVGQLHPFDDATTNTRSAAFRLGDALFPFNRFGANGSGGELPRP